MDTLEAVQTWQLSDEELTSHLLAAEQTLRRDYGRNLDLVAEFGKRGLAGEKGCSSTAKFLENIMFLSAKESRARVRQDRGDAGRA